MPKEEDDGAKRGGDERADKKSGARGEKPVEVSAVVDRVEDGRIAVLSLGDGKRLLDLPLSRLPEDTADGDHLRLTFDGEPSEQSLTRASKDRRSRDDAEDRIRKLQEGLSHSSGTQGKKDFKL
ncbi:MAG TPA: DUF3006 domain-containing protein [Pyrinomonadaceae bacterium]|nr:DUF3006 domain-containing protein [Pyrinomonadaceae bacterium]